jgi:hypothetical protein
MKYKDLFDLSASQEQMNDLMTKLNETVTLEDFKALEDRMDQYQLYKDCVKIKNDHINRFEMIEL